VQLDPVVDGLQEGPAYCGLQGVELSLDPPSSSMTSHYQLPKREEDVSDGTLLLGGR